MTFLLRKKYFEIIYNINNNINYPAANPGAFGAKVIDCVDD